jgi:hypothetical protein
VGGGRRVCLKKRNFAATCTCRDAPESPVAKRVFEITPNDVVPTMATRPGCPRFAWLKRSNTSTPLPENKGNRGSLSF